tara:strand:+ start:108 stop:275 length:168 start_codon:yes stop_codon:yes gene_type:complete
MSLEEIIPALALIAVLILVLPSFMRNIEKKSFFKNLVIWGIIILTLMIPFYFFFK